jgi:hypothetical protein
VGLNGIEHGARHERSAGVIKMHDVPSSWRIAPCPFGVEGLSWALWGSDWRKDAVRALMS